MSVPYAMKITAAYMECGDCGVALQSRFDTAKKQHSYEHPRYGSCPMDGYIALAPNQSSVIIGTAPIGGTPVDTLFPLDTQK